jgi:hypothetical protein
MLRPGKLLLKPGKNSIDKNAAIKMENYKLSGIIASIGKSGNLVDR